jgi:hypothetical protein
LFTKTKKIYYSFIFLVTQAFALIVDKKLLGSKGHPISRTYVARFPKASIFSIAVIVFTLFKKSNTTPTGVLVIGIGDYLRAYAIYTKGEFDLFRAFIGALRGYNRKEGKLWDLNDIS